MKQIVSRFAILAATANLIAMPLPANETPDPDKASQPTLEDVLALQARLEEIKSSDLPDDRKIGETLKLKNAIEDTWQRLRVVELEAMDEAPEPAPDPNDPSELYFQGWLLSRDAGKLEENDKPAEALEKLERARQIFDRVARDFPTWKPEMVAGRREHTAERQAQLTLQVIAAPQK
jgi:hypothetical protein